MQKNIMITAAALLVVAAVAGSAVAIKNNSQNKKEHAAMMMAADKKQTDSAAMMAKQKAATGSAMHDDTMAMADKGTKTGDAMMADKSGYITLADYNAAKDSYKDSKKVLFFHASWCPSCQAIEKEVMADPSKIPAKTAIIKTDFDTQNDLRKKYGVTVQHTFVQIDNEGNQIKKWSGETLAASLAEIQ